MSLRCIAALPSIAPQPGDKPMKLVARRALIAAALSWAGTDLIPWLQDQPGWGALAGALATALLGWATPLTRQYGVGAIDHHGEHEADDNTTGTL